MENNKITISLNTVIIIAIIIGALIWGLISSFFIYGKINNKDNNSVISDNKQNESLFDNNYNDVIVNNDDKAETNNNSANTSINKDEGTTSSSVTGKSSSKQNPLAIGEWGISSRYLSGEYVDVPARVTNVTRGSSAAQEVKQYLTSGSSIYKYEDAKEGMEWAVIEYNIDLTQIEKETTAKLDAKITGTGDNTSIKYNGSTYIVSTVNMTPNNYTKGNIETCKFAVQLPIGCTDYLIVLGSSSGSQAFFTGK